MAVNGPHGSGKASLLRLLGQAFFRNVFSDVRVQVVFPQEGSIFIPSHLRVLHVTQEASILDTSPWQNLIFGCGQAFKDFSLVLPGLPGRSAAGEEGLGVDADEGLGPKGRDFRQKSLERRP